MSMVHCKIPLACERPAHYVVHRGNADPDCVVCFLGRFLPKLGGAPVHRFFLVRLVFHRTLILAVDQA